MESPIADDFDFDNVDAFDTLFDDSNAAEVRRAGWETENFSVLVNLERKLDEAFANASPTKEDERTTNMVRRASLRMSVRDLALCSSIAGTPDSNALLSNTVTRRNFLRSVLLGNDTALAAGDSPSKRLRAVVVALKRKDDVMASSPTAVPSVSVTRENSPDVNTLAGTTRPLRDPTRFVDYVLDKLRIEIAATDAAASQPPPLHEGASEGTSSKPPANTSSDALPPSATAVLSRLSSSAGVGLEAAATPNHHHHGPRLSFGCSARDASKLVPVLVNFCRSHSNMIAYIQQRPNTPPLSDLLIQLELQFGGTDHRVSNAVGHMFMLLTRESITSITVDHIIALVQVDLTQRLQNQEEGVPQTPASEDLGSTLVTGANGGQATPDAKDTTLTQTLTMTSANSVLQQQHAAGVMRIEWIPTMISLASAAHPQLFLESKVINLCASLANAALDPLQHLHAEDTAHSSVRSMSLHSTPNATSQLVSPLVTKALAVPFVPRVGELATCTYLFAAVSNAFADATDPSASCGQHPTGGSDIKYPLSSLEQLCHTYSLLTTYMALVYTGANRVLWAAVNQLHHTCAESAVPSWKTLLSAYSSQGTPITPSPDIDVNSNEVVPLSCCVSIASSIASILQCIDDVCVLDANGEGRPMANKTVMNLRLVDVGMLQLFSHRLLSIHLAALHPLEIRAKLTIVKLDIKDQVSSIINALVTNQSSCEVLIEFIATHASFRAFFVEAFLSLSSSTASNMEVSIGVAALEQCLAAKLIPVTEVGAAFSNLQLSMTRLTDGFTRVANTVAAGSSTVTQSSDSSVGTHNNGITGDEELPRAILLISRVVNLLRTTFLLRENALKQNSLSEEERNRDILTTLCWLDRCCTAGGARGVLSQSQCLVLVERIAELLVVLVGSQLQHVQPTHLSQLIQAFNAPLSPPSHHCVPARPLCSLLLECATLLSSVHDTVVGFASSSMPTASMLVFVQMFCSCSAVIAPTKLNMSSDVDRVIDLAIRSDLDMIDDTDRSKLVTVLQIIIEEHSSSKQDLADVETVRALYGKLESLLVQAPGCLLHPVCTAIVALMSSKLGAHVVSPTGVAHLLSQVEARVDKLFLNAAQFSTLSALIDLISFLSSTGLCKDRFLPLFLSIAKRVVDETKSVNDEKQSVTASNSSSKLDSLVWISRAYSSLPQDSLFADIELLSSHAPVLTDMLKSCIQQQTKTPDDYELDEAIEILRKQLSKVNRESDDASSSHQQHAGESNQNSDSVPKPHSDHVDHNQHEDSDHNQESTPLFHAVSTTSPPPHSDVTTSLTPSITADFRAFSSPRNDQQTHPQNSPVHQHDQDPLDNSGSAFALGRQNGGRRRSQQGSGGRTSVDHPSKLAEDVESLTKSYALKKFQLSEVNASLKVAQTQLSEVQATLSVDAKHLKHVQESIEAIDPEKIFSQEELQRVSKYVDSISISVLDNPHLDPHESPPVYNASVAGQTAKRALDSLTDRFYRTIAAAVERNDHNKLREGASALVTERQLFEKEKAFYVKELEAAACIVWKKHTQIYDLQLQVDELARQSVLYSKLQSDFAQLEHTCTELKSMIDDRDERLVRRTHKEPRYTAASASSRRRSLATSAVSLDSSAFLQSNAKARLPRGSDPPIPLTPNQQRKAGDEPKRDVDENGEEIYDDASFEIEEESTDRVRSDSSPQPSTKRPKTAARQRTRIHETVPSPSSARSAENADSAPSLSHRQSVDGGVEEQPRDVDKEIKQLEFGLKTAHTRIKRLQQEVNKLRGERNSAILEAVDARQRTKFVELMHKSDLHGMTWAEQRMKRLEREKEMYSAETRRTHEALKRSIQESKDAVDTVQAQLQKVETERMQVVTTLALELDTARVRINELAGDNRRKDMVITQLSNKLELLKGGVGGANAEHNPSSSSPPAHTKMSRPQSAQPQLGAATKTAEQANSLLGVSAATTSAANNNINRSSMMTSTTSENHGEVVIDKRLDPHLRNFFAWKDMQRVRRMKQR